ncbi:MAG: DUF5681 domain-containing protein [Rickettsiales bacterium]|jgi:hypothetical protein|nr:DUF5681 domain-containing protein [Rickettsiales bacterium]
MANYDVGYMKPPTATRFKPGQSGNDKGRPKGSKNTYAILDDLLGQKIQMTQDGKPIKLNKKTAALLQMVNKAVKGDSKAMQTLLPHMLIADGKNEERAKVSAAIKQDDMEIVKQLLKDNGHE